MALYSTDDTPYKTPKENIEVLPEWFDLALPQLVQLILNYGVGRRPRWLGVNSRPKKAWSADTSVGIRPAFTALRDLVKTKSRKTPSSQKVRETIEQLKGLVTYIEHNSDDWVRLIDSVFQRHIEGGELQDYDLSGFWTKFSYAAEHGRNVPVLVGPIYLDIFIGNTRKQLQSDVSFRSLLQPRTKIGGSLVVFGSTYYEITKTKFHILSLEANVSGDFGGMYQKYVQDVLLKLNWVHKIEMLGSTIPLISFILEGEKEVSDQRGVKKTTINSFSFSDHFNDFRGMELAGFDSEHQPPFVYNSGPILAKKIRRNYSGPIICALGHFSPDGRAHDQQEIDRSQYEGGCADVIFGGFYEFCRAWDINVAEDEKWCRDNRIQLLRQCFANIPKDTVMISRCLNYKSGRLNLFVFCNGILRDLSNEVADLIVDNMFLNARRFDAAFVDAAIRTAGESISIRDSFSLVCYCAVLASRQLSD